MDLSVVNFKYPAFGESCLQCLQCLHKEQCLHDFCNYCRLGEEERQERNGWEEYPPPSPSTDASSSSRRGGGSSSKGRGGGQRLQSQGGRGGGGGRFSEHKGEWRNLEARERAEEVIVDLLAGSAATGGGGRGGGSDSPDEDDGDGRTLLAKGSRFLPSESFDLLSPDGGLLARVYSRLGVARRYERYMREMCGFVPASQVVPFRVKGL